MSTRLIRTTLVGVTAIAAAGTALLATPAAAADRTVASAETRNSGHDATQTTMDAAVAAGVPGVVAGVRDNDGVWKGTSGVADLTTQQPRGAGDGFRAGSVTKSLVATVLLQLQTEGRVDLDAAVDHYLPGLVRGNGHGGTKIRVRQLMNHTSGIFNFTEDATSAKKVLGIEFLESRYDTWTPQQVIALALRNPPQFEPGTSWKYSNTNYLLLGLIMEKLTGRPYAEEIEGRVTRPLGMRATYFPGTDPHVPAPTRHYSTFTEDPGKTYDVTELNPSWAWAAGEMVTNSSDLNRFYTALFSGGLLRPAQLRQMTSTGSTEGNLPSQRYSLGLIEYETSCGVKVWGHSGGIHGSSTQAFGTKDGRHMITLNFNGDWVGGGKNVVSAESARPGPRPRSPTTTGWSRPVPAGAHPPTLRRTRRRRTAHRTSSDPGVEPHSGVPAGIRDRETRVDREEVDEVPGDEQDKRAHRHRAPCAAPVAHARRTQQCAQRHRHGQAQVRDEDDGVEGEDRAVLVEEPGEIARAHGTQDGARTPVAAQRPPEEQIDEGAARRPPQQGRAQREDRLRAAGHRVATLLPGFRRLVGEQHGTAEDQPTPGV